MHNWEGLTAPQFLSKPTPLFIYSLLLSYTVGIYFFVFFLTENYHLSTVCQSISISINFNFFQLLERNQLHFTLFKKKIVLAPLFVQKFSSKIFETPAFITFVASPHLHLTKLLSKYNTLSRTCYRAKNFSRLQISWTVWVT